MGVNFALEFTYSVSNKVRSFSSTDKSIESIGAYLRNFSDDDLFQGTGIQHLVVFEISANWDFGVQPGKKALKDFNFIHALASSGHSLPCKSKLHLLLQSVRDNDVLKFTQFLQSTEWLTTKTILEASSQGAAPSNGKF